MESGCVEMVNREVENNELENMDSGTISTVSALQALSNLLYSEDQKEDFYSEQTLCSTSSGSINPGNIGTHLTENVKVFSANSDDTAENIWNTEEIPEKAEFDDQWDGRELPEYEFVFKQQVRTEDLFLGLTRKDSSTACCENLVTKSPSARRHKALRFTPALHDSYPLNTAGNDPQKSSLVAVLQILEKYWKAV